MLEIDLLQNRSLMYREMDRRFARDDYDVFINSYERLESSKSIDSQKLTSLARSVTLESLENGIRQNDQVLTLVDRYLRLPNIAAPEVPTGKNSIGDVVVFASEYPDSKYSRKPRNYIELGTRLGIFDPEKSIKVAAEGFPFLFGAGASLDRALTNLMLDTHVKNGYAELLAPTLVNERSLFTTGAFPLYGNKSFHIEGTDLYLNPTIEVQQTNLLKNANLGNLETPLRLVGYSRSFRIEDEPMTLYTRLHEFGKTEIFVATRNEDWRKEHEKALGSVEEVLDKLELPYRKVLLCTGSMGLSYHLTYDYEVFAPGSNEWWEVASCSSHSDYSSRYMNATYQDDDNGKTTFVHTLHVTSVSLPRILSAVLENYQLENGNIFIPDALKSYMKNHREISPSNQPI